MAYSRVVGQTVDVGPFFSGDTGPDLDFVLLWDTGGYVDLTSCLVSATVRRWDPRKKSPLGAIITTVSALTIANAARGEATMSWLFGDPVSSVPTDPGWYVVQLRVSFPTGVEQESQRAVFEVMTNGAV